MTKLQKSIVKLINLGLTRTEIINNLGIHESYFDLIRKRFGLTVKHVRENTVIHNYFDVIDTYAKAYFLGFFIADGCVSLDKKHNARFSFNILKEDGYILDLLQKEINGPNAIIYKEEKLNKDGVKHRKAQARLRWTSVKMYKSLRDLYNIRERKTLMKDFIFPFEKISKEYYGSFILGFIDGDGSFESHDFVFTPSIVGTSIGWLKQIGDIVSENTGLTYKVYEWKGKTTEYYTLRWKADRIDKLQKITNLYNFLYNNAPIYLKRKRDKIERYLEYRAKQLGVTSTVSVERRD